MKVVTLDALTRLMQRVARTDASGFTAKTLMVKNQQDNTPLKVWVGTQSQYNALTPASDTLYFIV